MSKQRRPGAPKGNQNAKGNRGGHGGPLHNTNAEKTGEYSRILQSTFTAEESEIYDNSASDPMGQIDVTIRLLSVREFRMLKLRDELIQQQKLTADGANTDEQKFTDRILAIEDALTRVQDKKIKAIAAKQRMLDDRVKIEISGPDAQPIQVQQPLEIDWSKFSKEGIIALTHEVFSTDTD